MQKFCIFLAKLFRWVVFEIKMKRIIYILFACLVLTACQKNPTLRSTEDSTAQLDSISDLNSSSDIYSDIYRDGYSFHLENSCYTIKEDQVTREMWEEAYTHRLEFNYYRDTTDCWDLDAKVAAFRTLSEFGKESYVWEDLGLCNIGHISATDEYIVDIWHENEMEAVFVKDGVADSCIIAGSDYSAYGTNRIYVGCHGFDCDNHVWLYFYQTTDKPYHQTKFLCEYRKGDLDFGYHSIEDIDDTEWYSKYPMVWYKDRLYYRAIHYTGDNHPEYYRLQILRK